jgi:hypothetical protein
VVAPAIAFLFVSPVSAVAGSVIQLGNEAGILLLIGGSRMARRNPAGKRQAIFELATVFAVVLVLAFWSAVSRADPGVLLQGLAELLLVAAAYIDNLSDEVKKGMAEKVQEGGFPHQAPLGYRNAREGDRQVIAPDPTKAPMVRRAYELYATRAYSLKTLRKKLRDEGLATTKQGKLIGLSQLQWLLKNPFYYGAFRWKGRTWAGAIHH